MNTVSPGENRSFSAAVDFGFPVGMKTSPKDAKNCVLDIITNLNVDCQTIGRCLSVALGSVVGRR